MAFFLGADFGFGNASDGQYIGEELQRINTHVFAFGVGSGFAIFSTHDIGIEVLFKYNFARSQFETENAGLTLRPQQKRASLTLQWEFNSILMG